MAQTFRRILGVIGASRCGPDVAEMAREVGRRIAEGGDVLLCGGGGGVMEAAARGAKEAGGLTIGILGGLSMAESPPNDFIDLALCTGLRDGRNFVNVAASHALIAISGGYGTLSEIALALKLGRPTVLLRSWRFEIEGAVDPGVIRAKTPQEAVELARSLVVPELPVTATRKKPATRPGRGR